MTSPPEDRPEHHVPWAIRLALAIVGAQRAFDSRTDAIQEACLAMSLAWKRYDPALGLFEDFAAKRVAGAVRRALKKQRRLRALEVILEEDGYGDALLDNPADPWARATRLAGERMNEIAFTFQLSDEMARRERGEEVIEELARLEPEELKLLELKYVQGLPMDEVASRLGIKARAARYRHAQSGRSSRHR